MTARADSSLMRRSRLCLTCQHRSRARELRGARMANDRAGRQGRGGGNRWGPGLRPATARSVLAVILPCGKPRVAFCIGARLPAPHAMHPPSVCSMCPSPVHPAPPASRCQKPVCPPSTTGHRARRHTVSKMGSASISLCVARRNLRMGKRIISSARSHAQPASTSSSIEFIRKCTGSGILCRCAQ